MINLEENLQPGKSIRKYYRKDNIFNQLLHIRAIVDEDQIIYRYWNYHRRGWVYLITQIYYFNMLNESHHLYLPGQKVVER